MFISEDLKDRIQTLLEKYPSFRDNRQELTAHIWREDIQELTGKMFFDYHDFEQLFKADKLTNQESIVRYARKVAEENEHLRGEQYIRRLEHEQKTKQHIKEMEKVA